MTIEKKSMPSQPFAVTPKRLMLLFLIGARPYLLWAQSPPSLTTGDGLTPAMLAPGSPGGSFQLSGFDTVNIPNGHLNITLPLAEAYGRGGMKVPLIWNQQSEWTVWPTPIC